MEPPLAAIAVIAFSMPRRVIISLGRIPRRSTSTTSAPEARAAAGLVGSCAGIRESPIGEIPSISYAIAIVFAVNWPPHAPAPGEATLSSSASSSSVIRPAAWAPTASKTS